MKYRVHKIEQNYNQIWHGIKANKNIVVNYNFKYIFFRYRSDFFFIFNIANFEMEK